MEMAPGGRRRTVCRMEVLLLVCAATVVWLAVLVGRWSVLSGALAGAAVSLGVSAMADVAGGVGADLLFGRASWIALAELLALGLLAGWATRVLPAVRAGVVLVAVTAAVVAMSEWRLEGRSNPLVNSGLLIGLAGCVGAGMLLRQSDRQRAVAAELARQDERLAIAHDLHDVVAHHVTGMVVQAQAGALVAGRDPQRAAHAFGAIEQSGVDALAAMHRMVGALRQHGTPAPIAPGVTLEELADLARWSSELGLPVRLHVEPDGAVPPEVAQSVRRVVRESLTNARRHAVGATVVDVSVEPRAGALDVVISDDGRARPGPRSSGFGLVGMAERVEALGGTFDAGPRPSGGWEVRATFPLLADAP